MEEVEISDGSSFFAHLPSPYGGYRQTYCGITLSHEGPGYFSIEEMRGHAIGKPLCSVCKEKVRM